MGNDLEIYGSGDIVVEKYSDNTVYIGLKDHLLDKLDRCVEMNDFYSLEEFLLIYKINGAFYKCHSLTNEIEELKKENKELRHYIARLNTRVNEIIAEKQVKEFYEKNNRECEVARC